MVMGQCDQLECVYYVTTTHYISQTGKMINGTLARVPTGTHGGVRSSKNGKKHSSGTLVAVWCPQFQSRLVYTRFLPLV